MPTSPIGIAAISDRNDLKPKSANEIATKIASKFYTKQMDSEGWGRKLLLTPPATPGKPLKSRLFGQDFYQTCARITGNQGFAQIFLGPLLALNTGK